MLDIKKLIAKMLTERQPQYPVGFYLWTSDSNYDPNVNLGGTWELMDEGLTLVSAGRTYTVSPGTSKDGGEATHQLTVNEMPAHAHNALMRYNAGATTGYGIEPTGNVNLTWSGGKVQNTGGGQAHNNMQPYKNAYCWHRTA